MKARFLSLGLAAKRHTLTALSRLLSRAPSVGLASVCTALALTLPMVLLLVVSSVNQLVTSWRADYTLSVYLDPALGDDHGLALADTWQAKDAIANVSVITRQQAADDFAKATGAGDLITALGDNPLPVVVQIWPSASLQNTADVVALSDELAAFEGVDEVDTDIQWLERADAILNTLQRATVLIAVLLGAIALALVGTAVRQQLAALSEEIALSKLVGARDSTLRAPFLIGGALIGLIAGVLAIALTVAALSALSEPVATLAASYQSDFQLLQMGFGSGAALLACAVLIGAVGAGLGVEYRLRHVQPA